MASMLVRSAALAENLVKKSAPKVIKSTDKNHLCSITASCILAIIRLLRVYRLKYSCVDVTILQNHQQAKGASVRRSQNIIFLRYP